MMWLLLTIGLVGLSLKMGGALTEIQREQRDKEREARQGRESQAIFDAEQALLRSQQAEVDKDILAAGNIYNINQKAFTIQGQQTAYAGASAKGQVGARAGAGNLQGASILRQAASIQKKTEQQMSLIAGEKAKLGIEYADTLREFDIKKELLAGSLLTSELKEKWTLENAEAMQEDADWLKKYGWIQVVGMGLSGLGDVFKMAGGAA